MLRDVDARLLTADRLYTGEDMAKLGCRDCEGCSHCCRKCASEIVLDPYDVRLLCEGLLCNFDALLEKNCVKLTVIDGIILPVLQNREDGACVFLGEDGRCSVHFFRPGICRLFPLARLWHEDGSFSYFLQEGECIRSNGAKIKIKKWLGYTNLAGYEAWIRDYHSRLNALKSACRATDSHDERVALQTQFLKKEFTAFDFWQAKDEGQK